MKKIKKRKKKIKKVKKKKGKILKTVYIGIMFGTLCLCCLCGCSSCDAQRFACLPKDHSLKDASTKKEAQYTPKGFFDPYSSNLNHWDSIF
ncbi:hypothetical protein ID0481_09060 [Helicobacter pylori]